MGACQTDENHPHQRDRLLELDTSITVEDIALLKGEFRRQAEVNPFYLDGLAKKMYKLNVEGSYDKAIEVGNKLLNLCPTSISAFKELGYAYSRQSDTTKQRACFVLMVKAIEAAQSTGNGSYESPYQLAHGRELFSLVEASWQLVPEDYPLCINSAGDIIHSCYIGRMSMFFADLSHARPYLKQEQLETHFMEGHQEFDPDDTLEELKSVNKESDRK